MRKVLLSLILSLLVLSPLQANNSLSDLYLSIARIDFLPSTGHCTAWSPMINRWVTAAHCMVYTDDNDVVKEENSYTINGKAVRLLKRDDGNDLVLFEGPTAPPLHIAAKEPVPGTQVVAIGWPRSYAGNVPLPFWGRVQATSLSDEEVQSSLDIKHPITLVNVGIAAGMSGGPVVDEATGEVIGATEWGTNPLTQQDETGLVGVKAIRKFLGIK